MVLVVPQQDRASDDRPRPWEVHEVYAVQAAYGRVDLAAPKKVISPTPTLSSPPNLLVAGSFLADQRTRKPQVLSPAPSPHPPTLSPPYLLALGAASLSDFFSFFTFFGFDLALVSGSSSLSSSSSSSLLSSFLRFLVAAFFFGVTWPRGFGRRGKGGGGGGAGGGDERLRALLSFLVLWLGRSHRNPRPLRALRGRLPGRLYL